MFLSKYFKNVENASLHFHVSHIAAILSRALQNTLSHVKGSFAT